MATYSEAGTTVTGGSMASLPERIEAALNEEPFRPWCVHKLHESLSNEVAPRDRDHRLMVTQLAADQLAADGRLRREEVSAITIGVQCQDVLYWSPGAGIIKVEEFGPDYESPTILRRLGSHFECHGL